MSEQVNKLRVRVYIAGPIQKGDIFHNISQAEDAFAVLAKAGFAPFCPHWACYGGKMTQYFYPDKETGKQKTLVLATPGACSMGLSHDEFLEIDFSFLSTCQALLRLPGESVGADAEVRFANSRNIPCYKDINLLIAEYGG